MGAISSALKQCGVSIVKLVGDRHSEVISLASGIKRHENRTHSFSCEYPLTVWLPSAACRSKSQILTMSLQNTENLASSHAINLGNTVWIPQDHTNLRRGQTLLGELADMLFNLGGGDLQPRWRAPLVRQSRWGHTLPAYKSKNFKRNSSELNQRT